MGDSATIAERMGAVAAALYFFIFLPLVDSALTSSSSSCGWPTTLFAAAAAAAVAATVTWPFWPPCTFCILARRGGDSVVVRGAVKLCREGKEGPMPPLCRHPCVFAPGHWHAEKAPSVPTTRRTGESGTAATGVAAAAAVALSIVPCGGGAGSGGTTAARVATFPSRRRRAGGRNHSDRSFGRSITMDRCRRRHDGLDSRPCE
jgi:hypothetical protein